MKDLDHILTNLTTGVATLCRFDKPPEHGRKFRYMVRPVSSLDEKQERETPTIKAMLLDTHDMAEFVVNGDDSYRLSRILQ